jgi:hypothetical protein
VPTFGDGGIVDATVGLSRMTDNSGKPLDKNFLEYNAAPTVYKDLIIMGTASGDRVYGKDPAGAVRAYDARTGKLVWSFHMIPQPGEFGNDTWPNDEWKTVGSTDVWPGVTVDEKRGLVYVPGGNPTNSYYGGKRIGNTLYAQTLVCLDANTGKRKWHFQTVHHDLWDLDLPTQPILSTITKDEKKIDAVIQIGKQGMVFVFNSVTVAVCIAVPLPTGLNVVATPGCTMNSPVSSATKGTFITCTVSGTPKAAGSSLITYTGSSSGKTDIQVPETFNVAKGLPSVAMSAQPTSAGVGGTITFAVTVTEAQAIPPTGAVGLYNATTLNSLGVFPLANGRVNIPWTPMNDPAGTNNWSKGTNWFYGVYAGDGNYLGHFSNPVDISIQ